MVECAALEMRFTGNGNVGSNPTLSATNLNKQLICRQNSARYGLGPTIGPISVRRAIDSIEQGAVAMFTGARSLLRYHSSHLSL